MFFAEGMSYRQIISSRLYVRHELVHLLAEYF